MNPYCALWDHADWLRSLRCRLIAVQHVNGVAFCAEHNLDDHIEFLCLRGIRIRSDDDFLIVQNAREGDDSLRKAGDSEVHAVAGERAKVETAVAQGGLLRAHRGD